MKTPFQSIRANPCHPWFILLCVLASLLFTSTAPAQRDPSSYGNFIGQAPRDTALANINPAVHPPHRVLVRGDKTNFCDLRPLYAWMALKQSERKKKPNPMPVWRYHVGARVLSVMGDDLLVESAPLVGRVPPRGVNAMGPAVLLLNYPGAAGKKDGDRLNFIAFETGQTYRYTDAWRAEHTIAILDHGTPYDPYQPTKHTKDTK